MSCFERKKHNYVPRSPCKNADPTPNYTNTINKKINNLQNQIDVLSNIVNNSITNSICIYFNSSGQDFTMIKDAGGRNIFYGLSLPAIRMTNSVDDSLWETGALGTSLHGKLKYKGIDPITVSVFLDYSATTPASGGDPKVGYNFEVQLYVNNIAINDTQGGTVDALDSSGTPIIISADPIASHPRASKSYTFTLTQNQVVEATVKVNHGIDVSNCTLYKARMDIRYNKITNQIPS